MEINSWFDLREIWFDLSGRPSFLRATRSERKKNCEKKKIEKGREIGSEKSTSALVPRGLAARPSRLLCTYCDWKDK